jgi:hypothetical protein
MVAIKSLAISTVCMLSMIGSSFQQIDSAFVKNCQLQLDIMDNLNNALEPFTGTGHKCPPTFHQKIERVYKCPVNAVSLIPSPAWSTEFQRQSDMNEKIKAQIDCLNYYTNPIARKNFDKGFF